MAVLVNTLTLAAMADTAIILKNYLTTHWPDTTGFTPPALASVNIDTKFARLEKAYHVIVENMPQLFHKTVIGGYRFWVEDVKRVQIYAAKNSAINDRFNMESHIIGIINSNPIGMQASGVQEAFIDSFQPITNQPDAKTQESEVESIGISRSYALVTLRYDLVRQ